MYPSKHVACNIQFAHLFSGRKHKILTCCNIPIHTAYSIQQIKPTDSPFTTTSNVDASNVLREPLQSENTTKQQTFHITSPAVSISGPIFIRFMYYLHITADRSVLDAGDSSRIQCTRNFHSRLVFITFVRVWNGNGVFKSYWKIVKISLITVIGCKSLLPWMISLFNLHWKCILNYNWYRWNCIVLNDSKVESNIHRFDLYFNFIIIDAMQMNYFVIVSKNSNLI